MTKNYHMGKTGPSASPHETDDLSGRLYRAYLKRPFDLLFGGILLLLFSPVIGIAWIAIRLTSPGPGFFKQQRLGLHNRPFYMIKLRSMYVDAEKFADVKEIQRAWDEGRVYKPKDDPRVTWVGRFLRRTSLAELPQLVNVLRGEMSLVGPRPLTKSMLDPYPQIKEVRCLVRPGITGEWQVFSREDNLSLDGTMGPHDLNYVRHCSFLYDLSLLLRTPVAVLTGRGAH